MTKTLSQTMGSSMPAYGTPERTALAAKAGITSGYTGTAEQNAKIVASLTKTTPTAMADAAKAAGYTGTTDPKKISGSASIGMNQATTDATGKAFSAVTGGKTLADVTSAQKTVSSQTTDPTTGNITYKYSDGTSEVKQPDATTAALYSERDTATKQLEAEYAASAQQTEATALSQIEKLEQQKKEAMAASETFYATLNPEGSGSDKAAYAAGVASKYDTAITEARAAMAAGKTNLALQKQAALANIQTQFESSRANIPMQQLQQQQIKANMLNTAIDNFQKTITNNPEIAKLFNDAGELTGSFEKVQSFIQTAKGMGVPEELVLPMIKTEVANSKAKQATIDQQAANAELAQRRLELSEASGLRAEAASARAETQLGLAMKRDQRAEELAARTQVRAIEQDFLKTNTASQSLSVGQQYLARIEAASGEGVSALGLIDALVKLDTGGQAVRQGQTDILTESGTWGDSWNRLKAKAGISDKVGANTILTKNQVAQIKTQAKKIAAEQIKAALPAYLEAKQGIESIKQDYPTESEKIDAYSSQLKSAETFIMKYGSSADKKAAGLSSGGGTVPPTDTMDFIKSLPGYQP